MMPGNQIKKKKQLNSYIKYSSLGIQMAAIIVVGVFFGEYLDVKNHSETPKFTIILSLLSIFASIYYVFKKTSNKNAKK